MGNMGAMAGLWRQIQNEMRDAVSEAESKTFLTANQELTASYAGGSDGGNGATSSEAYGGSGQGTTKREFGETTGKLYAGGGAGGKYANSASASISPGGEGGGGNGAWQSSSAYQIAEAGEPNTGGGGGGGASGGSSAHQATAGNGGTGIVCMREV